MSANRVSTGEPDRLPARNSTQRVDPDPTSRGSAQGDQERAVSTAGEGEGCDQGLIAIASQQNALYLKEACIAKTKSSSIKRQRQATAHLGHEPLSMGAQREQPATLGKP